MKLLSIHTLLATFAFLQAFHPARSQEQIKIQRVRPFGRNCDPNSGSCDFKDEGKDHDFRTEGNQEQPPEPTGDGFPSSGGVSPGIGRDEVPLTTYPSQGDDQTGYDTRPIGGTDFLLTPIDEPKRTDRFLGHQPKSDIIPTHEDFILEPTIDRYDTTHGGGGSNRNPPVVEDEDLSDDYLPEETPEPVEQRNCICVPLYQCKDGRIITDGTGLMDERIISFSRSRGRRNTPEIVTEHNTPLDPKVSPECDLFHVCCTPPDEILLRPYHQKCGLSSVLSPSNGEGADFGEWPWQVAVLDAKENTFLCGGVLIDEFHVLTTAYCVSHFDKNNATLLTVRLGEWDTQADDETFGHEDYVVSKIIVHPNFSKTDFRNDIALLRLKQLVLAEPHINTVCLPQRDEVFTGKNCVATSWGGVDRCGYSNILKEVPLQTVDDRKCEEKLRETILGQTFKLHEGFLCAGGESGLVVCEGDSGSPLVCYREDKRYVLAGLASWSDNRGTEGVLGVYTKVQKYLDWISRNTGVKLQEYWLMSAKP